MADRPTWKEKRRELEGRLGYAAFSKAQKWLLRKSPVEAEKAGAKLGRLLFKSSKKHRERAYRNFRLVFPTMSEAEMQALAQKVFEHYGRTTADFITSANRTLEQLNQMVVIEGLQHLDSALAEGKGVIFITGHFGNWELLAQWLSLSGYKLTVVARDVRNTSLNQKVNAIRTGAGTKLLARGGAAKGILETLRRNEMVGILPDQNEDEIFIPLFGKTAGTVLGPGVIQARTKSVVVCGWCAYEGPQKYRIIFEPALEPEPGYEAKGEGMMRAIHGSLERIVKRYPEQWLWFHDRWKSARQRGLLD